MAFWEDRLLPKEPREIPPGLKEPGGLSVLEKRPDNSDPAGEEGGQEKDEEHLEKVDDPAMGGGRQSQCHRSTDRRMIRVEKL